jgi:hypothetical protein
MMLLYEAGIVAARAVVPKPEPADAAPDDPAR